MVLPINHYCELFNLKSKLLGGEGQWNEYKRTTKIIEAMGIYYNFIWEHNALGETHPEAYGIKIEGENKLLMLIQNSSIHRSLK
jgi:hypothetical protein